MKTMVISDIRWVDWDTDDLLTRHHNYFHLSEDDFVEIVEAEAPDQLLLLGDIICDAGLDGPYEKNLARVLERLKLPTVVLWGNHDLKHDKAVAAFERRTRRRRFMHLAANLPFGLSGLECLPADFDLTDSLRLLRGFCERHRGGLWDLIVSHAPLGRRIFLFDLAPRVLLTGHFGLGIVKVRETITLMTQSFPWYYGIMTTEGRDICLELVHLDRETRHRSIEACATVPSGGLPPAVQTMSPALSDSYAENQLAIQELLLLLRPVYLGAGVERRRLLLRELLMEKGAPPKYIREFLGGSKRLDELWKEKKESLAERS